MCGHTVGVWQDLRIISSNAFFPAWLASSHERNWSVDSSTGSVLPSEKISQVYRFGAEHRCFTSTRRWRLLLPMTVTPRGRYESALDSCDFDHLHRTVACAEPTAQYCRIGTNGLRYH